MGVHNNTPSLPYTLSWIAEGKKLIDLTIVPKFYDNKEGFLADCKTLAALMTTSMQFYNLPELPELLDLAQNLLSSACIQKQQQHDGQLLALQLRYPEQYIYKWFDEDIDNIICYVCPRDILDKQWRIGLPQ